MQSGPASKHSFGVLFLFVAVVGTSAAQNPVPTSASADNYVPTFRFEVASIRETKSVGYQSGSTNPSDSSYFVAKNLSVGILVQWSFGLHPWQIVGGPDWIRHVPFYIEAKSDEATDARLASLPRADASAEKSLMIRGLLEERFHLQTHWEMQDQPVYELVVSKSGPKLAPGGSLPLTPEETRLFGGAHVLRQSWEQQGMEFFAHGCSMDLFASTLSGQMEREVVNRTGLTGTYDFHIQYKAASPDDRTDDPTKWPPLIFSLEDQLGLKLRSAHGSVRVLVIDHLERPEEN